MGILPASLTSQSRRHARLPRVPCSQGWQPLRLHQGCQTQLSHRYASDTRNAQKTAEFRGQCRFVVLKITALSEDIWH